MPVLKLSSTTIMFMALNFQARSIFSLKSRFIEKHSTCAPHSGVFVNGMRR